MASRCTKRTPVIGFGGSIVMHDLEPASLRWQLELHRIPTHLWSEIDEFVRYAISMEQAFTSKKDVAFDEEDFEELKADGKDSPHSRR